MDLTQFTPSSALLTVVLLSLAPFVVVMITSFTKIVVVLSLLRNALGVQQVPPNLVLNGLAMVLTIYVMYPVGQRMMDGLYTVDGIGSSTEKLLEGANAAKEPLREFLLKHAKARIGSIRLEDDPDMAEAVRLTIHDDGQGGADFTRGSGLVGMRARVEGLDGTLQVDSPFGGPTTLVAVLPLDVLQPVQYPAGFNQS